MSRESLFDLISLSSAEGWEDRQQSQRPGRAQLPTWGCDSLAPHTALLLGGLNEKPKGMGVKQRRCRAQVLQTGLSSCAPHLGHHRPQPTLT